MAAPSVFRKKYTEKKLTAKILNRVYIPQDRKWLASLFGKNEAGLYTLTTDSFSKADEKKLKALAKSIKQNRGIISRPKVFIAAAVIILVSCGYYFFRNILIEKALTASLELVFQARASVSGLNFDLFEAKLEWFHLEVANRDRPMKNLFETGHCEANFSMRNLLKARFVVENLEAKDIRWNTDRKTSGALPEAPKKAEAESGGFLKEAGESVASAISSFDVKEILQREFDKLASPKAAARIKEDLQSRTAYWKEKTAAAREEILSLETQAKEIRAIDPKAVKKPEEIISLLAKVNAMYASVRKTSEAAQTLKKDFNETLDAASRAKSELQKAVTADYAYAASLVSLSGNSALSLASGLFTDFAAEHLGVWYTYGMRAVEIARSLPKSEKTEEKEEDPSKVARYGRIVLFPVTDNLPKLWIKRIAFNTTGNAEQKVDGTVTDITGSPDLIGKPAAFNASVGLDGKNFTLEGAIDMRRAAEANADMKLTASGLPITIKLPKPVLSISSLGGPLNVGASMRILRAGGMTGELAGNISSPKVQRGNERDKISDTAYSVLSSVRNFDVAARYSVGGERGFGLEFSSSVDKALRDGFRRYLKEQEGVYKALMQEEVKKRLASYIAENENLQKGITQLQKLVGDNITDIDAYRKLLDDKKKSLESQSDALKKQAADALLKEAQKKLPGLPKLPGR
ncbi:MAG: TIGR03545 family protein [Spirochaetales bacterium]|jgi:uncharacterized protein (TIGR03545 family)|nr:TIGR03545 family protein [Spirochaetales bacterium]